MLLHELQDSLRGRGLGEDFCLVCRTTGRWFGLTAHGVQVQILVLSSDWIEFLNQISRRDMMHLPALMNHARRVSLQYSAAALLRYREYTLG